eukprot:CAMPEP_0185775494 /NCGR_PEP_ID=MMETSP1174-20130828/82208_1 /TAXON_ID=35687 /ORGANISM="Dictyocha speculum, Strain CCMP1381" /LENGTH=52 /DNA_ID=CAMNT_0028463085 /DNA_START=52 /DNA_END=207 /DNA_ORIENTATION=-
MLPFILKLVKADSFSHDEKGELEASRQIFHDMRGDMRQYVKDGKRGLASLEN